MNTQRLIVPLVLIVFLLVTGCAPKAAPSTPIASSAGDSVSEAISAPPVEQESPPRPEAVSHDETAADANAPQVIAQEPSAAQPAGQTIEQPAEQAADLLAHPQATAAPTAMPYPTAAMNTAGEEYGQDDHFSNPIENAWVDHLSTFALDVDTASYAIARSYVMDGMLPPADLVRVEEFVNAFDQGYQASKNEAFTIYADGAPSPFDDDGAYIMRVGIQGYEVTETQRKPLSLTFVIDTSGSMGQQERLKMVKQSLKLLVDRLDQRDTVAIVAYGSQARVVLEPTSANHNAQIKWAINLLNSGGSTNAEAGLQLGYAMAMEAYQFDAVNRVILCSDGVANVGQTSSGGILSTVRDYVAEGVTLTTIGVGMGSYNDDLLEELANNGDGNYSYVDTLDEARKVLVEDMVSTMQVIAYDARVQVDFNPEVVSSYRLLGYENRAIADQDFRDDEVDAGEIGAGHTATALYAVYLYPGSEGRIATVQLRWQNPDTYETHEINGNFNTWGLAHSFEDAAPHFQLAVLVGQYAEILRHSPYASESAMPLVSWLADQVAERLPRNEQAAEFAQLTWHASALLD